MNRVPLSLLLALFLFAFPVFAKEPALHIRGASISQGYGTNIPLEWRVLDHLQQSGIY